MALRFHLPPDGDVPPAVAARQMGMTLEAFQEALPGLIGRGFPAADLTTGNFYLKAIVAWQDSRYPHLLSSNLTHSALNARDVVSGRVARLRGG